MRRFIPPRLLLTVFMVVLAACTSGSGGSAQGTSTPPASGSASQASQTPPGKASPSPVDQPSEPPPTDASPSAVPPPVVGTLPIVVNQPMPVTPGTYVTAMKNPPLSITLPDQWTLYINTADSTGGLIQMNAGARFTGGINETAYVFDYFGKVIAPGREDKVVSTPDLVSFLQHDPHYKVIGGPSPVRVGGLRGTSIDIEAVDPPTCTYYPDAGATCWNVMPMANADPFTPINREIGEMLVVGNVPSAPKLQDPARLVIVPVQGQTVIIEWNDKAPSFHSTLSIFQRFLGGVQWTSTPVVPTPVGSPTSGPAAGTLSVTSTLDGRTTLPQRIRWTAHPSSSAVEEVDFLIDGQPAWVEHNPPYDYGNDGNWLVTSFLKPGPHTFNTKAVGASGEEEATDTVRATVSGAPAPPSALAGTWSRVVTTADVKKAASDQPPPAGRWELRIDSEGWHLRDPNDGTALFDVVDGASGRLQMRPTIAHPPIGNSDTGGFCEDTDPISAWSSAIHGGRLVLHPVGHDPCGDRAAILEGTWTEAAA